MKSGAKSYIRIWTRNETEKRGFSDAESKEETFQVQKGAEKEP